MIEGTVSMATENPQWFKNLDPLDPKLIEVFNTGYVLPIPKKDKNGCRVLFQRPGMVDPESKIYGMDEQLRAGIIAGSYLYQQEETQVHGLVFIFDFTGYGIKHAAQGSLEVMKKWAKAIQGNMPGRFRAFHFYNVGPVFESMFNLLKPFVSKKFSDRVFMHGSNFEGVYKHVPMECLPEDYLPDDYTGPNAGSVKEIIENFKQGLAAPTFRAMVKYDSDPKWTCDLRKKPRDEPQNSFRKLNID